MIFTPTTYCPAIYAYVGFYEEYSVLLFQLEVMCMEGNSALIIPLPATDIHGVNVHTNQAYFLTDMISQHQQVSDFPASMTKETINDDNLEDDANTIWPEIRSTIEDVEHFLNRDGIPIPENTLRMLKFYYPGFSYMVCSIKSDQIVKTVPVSVLYNQVRIQVRGRPNWSFFPGLHNCDSSMCYGYTPSIDNPKAVNTFILAGCEGNECMYTEPATRCPEFIKKRGKLYEFTDRVPNGDIFFNPSSGEYVRTAAHLANELPAKGSGQIYKITA